MKLTDYLAIYGALLSTAVFAWNTARARPNIRVRLTFAIDGEGEKSRHGIGISVQNPSSHTAHIAHVSFLYLYARATLRDRIGHMIKYRRLPNQVGWCQSALIFNGVKDGCPVSIEPGQSHWIFVPDEVVRTVLASAVAPCLKVVVQDALWRDKFSNKLIYDLPRIEKRSK